jgi:hypothetical protein
MRKVLGFIIIGLLSGCANYDYFIKTSVAPKSPAYRITVIQENTNSWWNDHFSRGIFYTELMENGFLIVESGNKVFSSRIKQTAQTSPLSPPEPASNDLFIYDIEFIKETGRLLNVEHLLFITVNPGGSNARFATFKLVKTADGSVVTSTTAFLHLDKPKQNLFVAKLVARDIRNTLTTGKTVVTDYGRPNGD